MNVASQFMHAPRTRHLIALHCIGALMVGPSLLWARAKPALGQVRALGFSTWVAPKYKILA